MRLLLAAIAAIVVLGVWLLLSSEGDAGPGAMRAVEVAAVATQAEPITDRAAIEVPTPAGFVFRIKVVRDDDGAPVPGAELRTGSNAWRSDGNGLATIRHGERTLTVQASSGELQAHGVFRVEDERDGGDFELRLMRDVTLVFVLLDESDAPVSGVRVVATSGEGNWSTTFGPSDASGRITVQHAQMRVLDGKGFEVFAHVAGPPGEAVPVPLDPVPVEPVIVRVPPCANLEVVALDANGGPMTFAQGERAMVWAKTKASPHAHAAEFDSVGIARLQAVRCGATLTVSSSDLADAHLTVTAPERAGETKRVELRVPAGAPVLTGRLVTLDGAVFSGNFVLDLRMPDAGGEFSIAAGAEGRFRLMRSDLRAGSTPPIQVYGRSAETPPRHLAATVALARPLLAGTNELGDIVLAPAPELVRGRAEWSDGSAARGIRLLVWRETEPGQWQSDTAVRVDSADDGSFIAWGLHDHRRCQVRADPGEVALRPESVDFAPGARDVVIRLERGSIVDASFLVDDDTPWRTFQFTLVRAIPPPYQPLTKTTEPRDDGRMQTRWLRVPPGSYRLAVSNPVENSPLVTVDDIAVTGGRVADDPRLRDIDLRGRMHRCELLIVGPDDRPIAEPGPSLRRVGPGRFLCSSLGPGRFEIPLTTPIDLVIEAPGYEPREHRAVAGRATVRLGKAAEYRLRCTTPLPPGTTFALVLRRIDPTTNRTDRFDLRAPPLVVDSAEPVRWAPATSDAYEVRLLVRSGRASGSVSAFTPTRIEVRTLIPGQIIEIVPDPAALAAALAKLKD
ncbi:MAG: hypothetical protein HZB39_00130 [Planctomycetes bacterium]|nr:hypothetical protein [Planctomycetota bacterium]